MLKWLFGGLVALLLTPLSSSGYSVLTHQANIDSTWKKCLLPLLQKRYPNATKEQLIEAKSYAYGGAIIQDMGFYPFGSKLFTNLTHYVRSGDFVRNLLLEATDRNEFAFALGALGHYAADISGHPEGTNKAMASVYPELKAKFGNIITYDEAPAQHTQLEFAFDVVQVAAGRYRTEDYHNYIGFQVSKPVLERAFEKTYGPEAGPGHCQRGPEHRQLPLRREPADSDGDAGGLAEPAQGNHGPEPAGAPARVCVRPEPAQVPPGISAAATTGPASGPGCWPWPFGCCPRSGPSSRFAFVPPTPEAQALLQGQLQTGARQLLRSDRAGGQQRHAPAAGQLGLRHRPPHQNRRISRWPTKPTASGCASWPRRSLKASPRP